MWPLHHVSIMCNFLLKCHIEKSIILQEISEKKILAQSRIAFYVTGSGMWRSFECVIWKENFLIKKNIIIESHSNRKSDGWTIDIYTIKNWIISTPSINSWTVIFSDSRRLIRVFVHKQASALQCFDLLISLTQVAFFTPEEHCINQVFSPYDVTHYRGCQVLRLCKHFKRLVNSDDVIMRMNNIPKDILSVFSFRVSGESVK